jgi:hypothetical protein
MAGIKIKGLPNPAPIVRYKGLFDFDEVYASMAEWFKRYRFWFHEELYKHKVPSPLGAEQEINWYGTVNVTDYIQYRIDVIFHMWDLTEVEVVRNGKKKTLTNARVEATISGTMIVDWQGNLDKNRFTRGLRTLYNKYIWRRKLESIYGDTLVYRVFDLHAYLKKLLDMQTTAHEYEGYLGENR